MNKFSKIAIVLLSATVAVTGINVANAKSNHNWKKNVCKVVATPKPSHTPKKPLTSKAIAKKAKIAQKKAKRAAKCVVSTPTATPIPTPVN